MELDIVDKLILAALIAGMIYFMWINTR